MSYSFIAPRKKRLLDSITKLWLFFIVLIAAILIIFDIFIRLKTSSFVSQADEYAKKQVVTQSKTKEIQKQIAFVKKQKALAEEVYASNTVLKESMKNLFDLVPDQITLSRVLMDKDSLIIYGITPSKDTYNFLLGSPLRSIFYSSNTLFYLRDDGWFRFVSVNKSQSKGE